MVLLTQLSAANPESVIKITCNICRKK